MKIKINETKKKFFRGLTKRMFIVELTKANIRWGGVHEKQTEMNKGEGVKNSSKT